MQSALSPLPEGDVGESRQGECTSVSLHSLSQLPEIGNCQPCRARAPFVRNADISPADGGISPLRGSQGVGVTYLV